jgi:hypothetical protein
MTAGVSAYVRQTYVSDTTTARRSPNFTRSNPAGGIRSMGGMNIARTTRLPPTQTQVGRSRSRELQRGRSGRLMVGLCALLILPLGHAASGQTKTAAGLQGVLTYHNDNARSGQNAAETILTPANVNNSTFGKLFAYPVDGQVYAQPLYVPGVSIRGKGVHNIIYVVTEHDSVYAFDADGKQNAPLWSRSFLNAKEGISSVPASDTGGDLIAPEIGITSTPVIDPASGTIYIEATTKHTVGRTVSYAHHMHALSLSTGAEKFGGPKTITASMRATGDGSSRGSLTFSPLHQLQRAALLLANGVIYVAFASYADVNPYHAWVLAYSARTLGRVGTFNGTPDGSEGGIWQTGNGPASDATGAIFVGTGNGSFDADTGGRDYGDSLLKLVKQGSRLTLNDYFTPAGQQALSDGDLDFATGGPLLLPDQAVGPPHLVLIPDKTGTVYLVNRDNLGHYNAGGDTQIVQEFQVSGQMFSSAAYFNNRIYLGPVGGPIAAYPITGGQINTAGLISSAVGFGYPGASPSVSANGVANGIVWAIDSEASGSGPAILYAYDAATLTELYDSTQAGARDVAGIAVNFTTPTIAAGKVYVGTQSELDVYGLLP